jgi:hypothetical protein
MQNLRGVLDALRLRQAEFARLLDVSTRTVSLWMAGSVALPGPVLAYLRLLKAAPDDMRDAEFARVRSQGRQLSEGVYNLQYGPSAQSGKSTGHALAVLSCGRIAGADHWGGHFTGSYQFDAESQTSDVRLKVHVPPDGELITGFSAGQRGATLNIFAKLKCASKVASAVADIDGQPVEVTLTYLRPLAA